MTGIRRASVVGLVGSALSVVGVGWPGGEAFAARVDLGQENPDLSSSCGTDVIVVLDESASIASPVDFTPEMRAAVLNFTTGLVGTGSRMRLVEFSTNARDVSLTGGTGFQTVTGGFRDQVNSYLNGTGLPQEAASYHPSTAPGAQIYTNWEAGLHEAASPGSPRTGGVGAPLVVFITDGDSNTDGISGNSVGANLSNTDAGYQAGADAAISEMAALQAAGGHVLSIAVGAASQQQASYNRLTQLTEPGAFEQWTGAGELRLSVTDALRVTFFEGLRTALSGVLNSLCGAGLTIRKVDGAGNVIPGRAFDLTVRSSPSGRGMEWLTPSTAPTLATTPSTRTVTTGSDGIAAFSWMPGTSANPETWTSQVSMSETLPEGWTAGDATCLVNDTGSPLVLTPTVSGQVATWGGASLLVGPTDTVACTVVNRRPTQVTIRKVATPADGTDFRFTTTSTGSSAPLPASLSLDVDDDAALPSTQTFTVSPGAYTVTEAAAAAGSSWRLSRISCRMSAQSPGSSARTSVSTRTATLTLFAGDQVTCTYTNTAAALPQLSVAKSASPTSFQESAGSATYGVAITNPGTEPLTISEITDAVNLRGASGSATELDLSRDAAGAVAAIGATVTANTCDDLIARRTVVEPGQTVNCSVTMAYTGRDAGQVIDDTIAVTGVDAARTSINAQSTASVTVLDREPVMVVDKQNVETSIIAPGGVAAYNLVITNGPNATEPITLLTLTDQMYVDAVGPPATFVPFGPALNITTGGGAVTETTCGALINQVLAPGASVSCAITIDTTQLGTMAAGGALRNQISATSRDDEGTVIRGQDIADRPVLLTAPLLDVWKTDGRATVVEPGSQVTYAIWIDNRGEAGVNPWLRIDKIVDEVRARASSSEPIGPNVGVVTIDAAGVTATFTREGVALVDTTCGALIGTILQPANGLSPYPGFGQDAPRLRPTNADARSECTITLQLPGNTGHQYDDLVTVDTVDPGEGVVRGTNGANTPVTGAVPVLSLLKTAEPTIVVEPGGAVEFTLQVTNQSVASDPVTITQLSDSVFGDLMEPGRTDTDCAGLLGLVLQPGGSAFCRLSRMITGNVGQDHVNTAVVSGVDDDLATVTATDDAVVTIADALPTVTVAKRAIAAGEGPAIVSELGADVTYQVDVMNTSPETVTVTGLVDNQFGDLNGHGTCETGELIAIGESYVCTFTALVRQTGSEPTHINVVTASVVDDEGNDGVGSDDETVAFQRIAPKVRIAKTDNGATLPEPGGAVVYSLTIENPGDSLEDLVQVAALTNSITYRDRAAPTVIDLLGPVGGEFEGSTCPTVIAAALPLVPGEAVECSFTVRLAGTSQTVTDNAAITMLDNDGESVTATGGDLTSITDVPPAVSIVKSADPVVFPAGEATTYHFTITNGTAAEPFQIVRLVDDRFGDLTAQCWGATPPLLAPRGQPGDAVTCTLNLTPAFDATGSHRNVVTVSGGDDELLELIRNPGEGAPPPLVTASDDETVTVGARPTITVQLAAVCVNDAPYITYDITPVGFTPTNSPTLTVYDLDGRLVRTIPVDNLSGRLLYPGAALDATGSPTDWPGWKQENGQWVNDPSDARLRDGLRIVATVNPTAEATVGYPPATAACVGPKVSDRRPGDLPLPEAGASDVAASLALGGYLVATGVVLTLVRRRRARVN